MRFVFPDGCIVDLTHDEGDAKRADAEMASKRPSQTITLMASFFASCDEGWIVMRALLLASAISSPAFSAEEWPDGPNKQFFQNLQRPDNHKRPYDQNAYSKSCCGPGDVTATKFMGQPSDHPAYPRDAWYAWLNDEWTRVPDDLIVSDYAPDGQAYLLTGRVNNSAVRHPTTRSFASSAR